MSKIALITGVTGQDGAYLAELLLEKGYEVHGLKRRSSSFNTYRIDHLIKDPHLHKSNFFLHHSDLSDPNNITRLIQKIQPDEIYNLGAMSHVHVSFDLPEYSANIDGIGTLRILEAVKLLGMIDKTKIYQASTSELFGKVQAVPQSESTPFYPRSPYAVAKQYAYWITVNYREAYNINACNGILFNHESPMRGETFVTRKITIGIAKLLLGLESKICLGNLASKRDWGDARDYVRAMWLMLQQEKPIDLVIATGVSRSIKDFLVTAFRLSGISIKFDGEGIDECGYIDSIDPVLIAKRLGESFELPIKVGDKVIEVDSYYFRPTEVDELLGDPTLAKKVLNWEPEISFDTMVEDMLVNDIKIAKSQNISTRADIS